MSKNNNQTISIIGAGLGGCYLAVLLAKRGYTVNIYEKSSEKEIINSYTSQRSYNLTFYDFGIQALKEAGVWEEIEPTLVKLVGSVTQISNNPERFVKDKPYHAVQRDILLKALITKAKKYPSVTFHFGTPLVTINRQERTIVIQADETEKYTTIPCDVIFGADGVNSQVRALLQLGQQTKHVQEYANWEYKQIHITAEMGKRMQLKSDLMYAWTRKESLILAHPNIDESFSALLIVPKGPNVGFNALTTEEAIIKYFSEHFKSFLLAIDSVVKELLSNPTSYFVTIYTLPWYYKDFIVIIGDAAHGFNPFYGQGVSAAFADCQIIASLIDKHDSDWETIFPLYQQTRKKHTDALATLSKDSIKQYRRHKKADYAAVYNKLDVTLYQLFPSLFVPPPYVHIATNPMFAGDYLEKHSRQRNRAKWIGVPLAVGLVTGAIAVQEILSNYFSKEKH